MFIHEFNHGSGQVGIILTPKNFMDILERFPGFLPFHHHFGWPVPGGRTGHPMKFDQNGWILSKDNFTKIYSGGKKTRHFTHPKNPWDVMGCQNHLFWGPRVSLGGSGVSIGGFTILRAGKTFLCLRFFAPTLRFRCIVTKKGGAPERLRWRNRWRSLWIVDFWRVWDGSRLALCFV